MSTSRKYAINTSWILIEKFTRVFSGMLVGILVARYLGPEQFGVISYALNVVAIFSVFSTLGMDGIIVREMITRKSNQNIILGTSFYLRLIGAIGVVFGATFYSFIRDDIQNTYIVFIVSLSVVLQALTIIDFYFQSQTLGKFTAINQIITLVISSLVKLLLIYLNLPVEYFASMVVLEALLTMINQIWFYHKNGQSFIKWKFSWNEAKILITYSWPIIVTSLIMVIYQKMDQILIKRFIDLNTLGNYAAASRISDASLFIPVAVCAAILPGIINNRENKELQLQRLTQLYSLMLWTAFIICAGGLLFGDFVITFLYKEKFSEAPEIFKILIFNLIPVFYGTAWGMWMVAENKQKYMIIFQFVSMCVALFLNLKLIPLYGAKGAAYAISLTYFISLFSCMTFYKPLMSWKLFLNALNPINLLHIFRYISKKQ